MVIPCFSYGLGGRNSQAPRRHTGPRFPQGRVAQASACVVLIFLHPHFAQAEACATSSPFALHPYTAYPIRNQKQIQSAFVKNASYLPALTGTRARPDFFDDFDFAADFPVDTLRAPFPDCAPINFDAFFAGA